jgi:cardiolipin synthase
MFSTRALDNLNSRGRSFTAYLLYVKDCLGEGLENIRSRRSLALSIVRYSTLGQATILAALAFLYGTSDLQRYIDLVAYSLAGLVLMVAGLALHVGLLHGKTADLPVTLGLANRLTIARLLVVVPLVALILHDRLVAALVVYILCSGTDVFDGIVARRNGERTEFGAVMDPVADIVSTAGVFAALFARGMVPGWVFAILMVRYASLFAGWVVLFLAFGPIKFRPTTIGKIAGVLQAVGAIIIIALASLGLEWQDDIGRVLFPILGIVFGSVIVSQALLGARHIRKGIVDARSNG